MVLFAWNDKYSVGIKEFDNHHKTLVDIINELYEAMGQNKSNEILGKIIAKLVDYTKMHFAAEERCMTRFNYPDYAAQKREHGLFVDKILSFKRDFDGGKVAMSVALTSFLKNWLVEHISGTDKKYTTFFKEKGLL